MFIRLLIAILPLISINFSACTKSAKMAGASGMAVRPPMTITSARRDIQATNIHKIWVVTSNGNAYQITVDGEKVTNVKKWTGVDGSGGTRTYVTEGGFVAARWPYVYFIDPEGTPEGALTAGDKVDISQGLPGEDKSESQFPRICLASYQKSDNKRYLIAAWGHGRYREFPLNDTKPHKPDWTVMPPKKILSEINGWHEYAKNYPNLPAGKGFDQTDAEKTANPPRTTRTDFGWGYSCAIDQKKKIFYSQWYVSGPKKRTDDFGVLSRTGGALNLETGQYLDPMSVAPNATFRSTTPKLKDYTWSVGDTRGSYAVGSDVDGNIYNGQDANYIKEGPRVVYTMSHDPMDDVIWISTHGTNTESPQGKLTVVRRKCLTTEPNCTENKDFIERSGPESFIGPLSALKDGTVVGAVRRTGNDKHGIYLLRLEDPNDLAKGIRAKKLDFEVDGDPYMYVDFTGATLYTYESEQTFKVREIPGYMPRNARDLSPQKLLEVRFVWNNKPGTATEWQNIKLETRCYSDPSAKPAYEEVNITTKAGESADITTNTCKGKVAEFIDVKLSKIKGENLADVSDIQISIKQ